MNECPRCQTPLQRLSLADVETISCNRCGYADIPVDHGSERARIESWREAIDRF